MIPFALSSAIAPMKSIEAGLPAAWNVCTSSVLASTGTQNLSGGGPSKSTI
ncbi:hypothetical protein CCC_02280 [Paramagnetospirillum magnetotacticum MS-1]|uniref:Uncharacterized protein n=1 Tax=Paramagnetospirillum magnetotacticum MS-1 TaxID=272627 RepID=A0A0C2YVU3_PARME|nr:hypothetical protein CCC_02280 [Paramagnetospirillum magnetotacticum MS-1]